MRYLFLILCMISLLSSILAVADDDFSCVDLLNSQLKGIGYGSFNKTNSDVTKVQLRDKSFRFTSSAKSTFLIANPLNRDGHGSIVIYDRPLSLGVYPVSDWNITDVTFDQKCQVIRAAKTLSRFPYNPEITMVDQSTCKWVGGNYNIHLSMEATTLCNQFFPEKPISVSPQPKRVTPAIAKPPQAPRVLDRGPKGP